MALLSFRGISTPSLPAQGEQRRSSFFNIHRDNSSPNGSQPFNQGSSAVEAHRSSQTTEAGFEAEL
jgi:uncharacterized protein (DUF2461 family)